MRPPGFTLVELLVALALFATLSAIAVPGYARMLARWRLDAAARQVVMDVKLARARALADTAGHRVRFPNGGRYQHERQGASGTYAADRPATRLPDGIEITDCTAAGAGIGFRPRGYAATFGTISLRDRDGHERRIVVDIAGRTRVAAGG